MGSFLSNDTAIILVDKHMEKTTIYSKIDIILAPSFYWIKRAFLEVHFTSQALKYAPSIFEGSLPEGNYSYYAVKSKKEYIFYAFDPDEILAILDARGIQASQIGNVYFAQNELGTLDAPIRCAKGKVLISQNDTIIELSESLVDTTTIIDEFVEPKKLSKHRVTLHKSSIRHSFKELTPIMSALGAVIVLYAVQLFFTYSEQKKVDALPSVFETYKLPPTTLQNISIEKKLTNEFSEQTTFRKVISSILKLPLAAGQYIESVSYEKDQFKVMFALQEAIKAKDIELYFKNALGDLVKVEIEKNILRVKIK